MLHFGLNKYIYNREPFPSTRIFISKGTPTTRSDVTRKNILLRSNTFLPPNYVNINANYLPPNFVHINANYSKICKETFCPLYPRTYFNRYEHDQTFCSNTNWLKFNNGFIPVGNEQWTYETLPAPSRLRSLSIFR